MATIRHAREAKASYPKRGEIYLTALDPSVGREIQKTRPALIIQNDISNRHSGITIVAPITSTVRFPLNPVHVPLAADRKTGLAVTSVAVFNQIRATDRVRLLKRLGSVDDETMLRVDEAIKISLGLIRL
jgi:mRNA interferase MazF